MLNIVIVTYLPVFLSEALEYIQLLMGETRDIFVSPLEPHSTVRGGRQCRSPEPSPSEEIPSHRSARYNIQLIIIDQPYFILAL
jgi:hypothetical protein